MDPQILLFGPLALEPGDWLALFAHFALLSLLAIGGAITTAPDMHRFVVEQRGWLTDAQFTGSVALAQAAPGPNVLFVAVVGFNVGGLAGAAATLLGTLLPSTTLALWAIRLGERHRESRLLAAFSAGLAPVTIGLLLASGWILLEPTRHSLPAIGLVGATMLFMVLSQRSPLWPIAVGAGLGVMGWV